MPVISRHVQHTENADPLMLSEISTSLLWWKFRPTTPPSWLTYTGASILLPNAKPAIGKLLQINVKTASHIIACSKHLPCRTSRWRAQIVRARTHAYTHTPTHLTFNSAISLVFDWPCLRDSFRKTSSRLLQRYMVSSACGDSSASRRPDRIRPIYTTNTHTHRQSDVYYPIPLTTIQYTILPCAPGAPPQCSAW